ncbi:hypothetical protein DH86_00001837 [Scytalidium sp. 3C]|nr:hypothetical protein DH86_00001837 [Scytalidium sp. 3C]
MAKHSLYQHIEFDKITTLNESESGSGKAIVKKTWDERLQDVPELESDSDEQLLMHIPFIPFFYELLIRPLRLKRLRSLLIETILTFLLQVTSRLRKYSNCLKLQIFKT